jgi:hypothetical protein
VLPDKFNDKTQELSHEHSVSLSTETQIQLDNKLTGGLLKVTAASIIDPPVKLASGQCDVRIWLLCEKPETIVL